MRKISATFSFFLLSLLCATSLTAQPSNPVITSVVLAPSGSCTQGLPDQQVLSTGTLYSCQNVVAGVGTWGQIGGGGSGLTTNTLIKVDSSGALSTSSIIDNGIFVKTSEIFKGTNTQLLTVNASAISATAPGTVVFTWGALPVSTNFSFHCAIMYNQQTAAGGVGIAVQGATNAPTRLDAQANLFTSNAGASVQGVAQNITSTTGTSVVSGTPLALTTVYQAIVDGVVQVGALATTLNILMYTLAGADTVTPQAGSYCTLQM